MRLLALGGIVAPLVFGTATVLAANARADYSHVHQFISELGATGTPNALLMNYLGFVPTGLLFVGLAAAVATRLPGTRSISVASALLGVFGVGIVIAGLASCDAGCPQEGGSMVNLIHNQVSPLAFLAVISAAAVLAVFFRQRGGPTALWLYSAGTAAAGAGLMAGLVVSLDGRSFTGLWQRAFLSVVFLWCAVLGWYLYRLDELDPGSEPTPGGR